MSHLNNSTMDYIQVRKLILQNLKGQKLTQFCKENKLPYQQVMNLKRSGRIHYHSLARKILNSLGYKVQKIEKVTLYYLKNQ